jgi:hypothetical protein
VAVLRNLVRVGTLEQPGTFSEDVAVPVNPGGRGNYRVVAIVQDARAGKSWEWVRRELPNSSGFGQ